MRSLLKKIVFLIEISRSLSSNLNRTSRSPYQGETLVRTEMRESLTNLQSTTPPLPYIKPATRTGQNLSPDAEQDALSQEITETRTTFHSAAFIT